MMAAPPLHALTRVLFAAILAAIAVGKGAITEVDVPIRAGQDDAVSAGEGRTEPRPQREPLTGGKGRGLASASGSAEGSTNEDFPRYVGSGSEFSPFGNQLHPLSKTADEFLPTCIKTLLWLFSYLWWQTRSRSCSSCLSLPLFPCCIWSALADSRQDRSEKRLASRPKRYFAAFSFHARQSTPNSIRLVAYTRATSVLHSSEGGLVHSV